MSCWSFCSICSASPQEAKAALQTSLRKHSSLSHFLTYKPDPILLFRLSPYLILKLSSFAVGLHPPSPPLLRRRSPKRLPHLISHSPSRLLTRWETGRRIWRRRRPCNRRSGERRGAWERWLWSPSPRKVLARLFSIFLFASDTFLLLLSLIQLKSQLPTNLLCPLSLTSSCGWRSLSQPSLDSCASSTLSLLPSVKSKTTSKLNLRRKCRICMLFMRTSCAIWGPSRTAETMFGCFIQVDFGEFRFLFFHYLNNFSHFDSFRFQFAFVQYPKQRCAGVLAWRRAGPREEAHRIRRIFAKGRAEGDHEVVEASVVFNSGLLDSLP